MNGVGRGENNRESKTKIATRETVGMTLLLFSAVIFFIAVTGKLVFGDIGVAITAFFVGLSGFFVYPLLILAIYLSLTLIIGKNPIPRGWILRALFLIITIFFVVHTATAEKFYGGGYAAYLSGCWNAAKEGAVGGTGGGVIFGIIAYPVRFLLSKPGAFIIFSLLIVLACFVIFAATPAWRKLRKLEPRQSGKAVAEGGAHVSEGARDYPAPVSFEDLERQEPARTVSFSAQPQQNYTYPPAPAAPAPRPAEPERPSLSAMLGQEPIDYRGNLIFDSEYTSRPRRSSVSSAGRTEARESYSDRYAQDAEDVRSPMPRKVVENSGRPITEINYPQKPSYRAPDPSESRPSATGQYDKDLTPPESYTREISATERPAEPVRERPVRDIAPAEPFPRETAPEPPRMPEPDRTPTMRSDRPFVNSFMKPEETDEPAEPLRPLARTSRFGETPAPAVRDTERELAREPEREIPREPVRDVPARESAREILNRESRLGDRRAEPDLRRDDEDAEDDPGEFSTADNALESRRPVSSRFDDDSFDEDEPVETDSRLTAALDRRRGEPAGREKNKTPAQPPKPVHRKYTYPSLSSFKVYDETVNVSDDEIVRNREIILETLRGFRVEATSVGEKRGPTITQYNIDIPSNVAVSAVTKYQQELAIRLHANNVRIYANPTVGAISIEIPNAKRSVVGMRSVMESDAFRNSKPESLIFAMGKTVEGEAFCGDVYAMTHVLLAGTTGSGKSVLLNSLLISLICKYTPDEVRLILIDPKKIEFAVFEGLPHLMINEVIDDMNKAAAVFKWCVAEMERRYLLFKQKLVSTGANIRTVDDYNKQLEDGEERLPKIVVVVDEFADLMQVASKDVEGYIQRLAQKARAAGIHLVIATQRPTSKTITGTIKGNLPTRISFKVDSELSSRIILDDQGAETLLGKGDMLYKDEQRGLIRLQGVFLSNEEVQTIISDVKAHNDAYFDNSVSDFINKTRSTDDGEGGGVAGDDAPDEVYLKALRIVVKMRTASISLIQRKCSVGYNHAGKIIEWMEAMGYITEFDGTAKAREVLMTKEEFEAKYGGLD